MKNKRTVRIGLRLSGTTLVLCLALGILMALPFKVISQDSSEPLPSESRQELINRMSKIDEENQLLRTELEQSRASVASLEANVAQGQEASQELTDSLTRYRILAGLDPVHGPGIKLTLSEQETQPEPGTDMAYYLIHQEDLLNIVNEMRLAGAEAIAIRSRNRTERLINTSTIRCVGSLIDVNNTRMTPPFDIFAIGDPDDLYNALTMPYGVLEPLGFYNIQSDIVKLDDMELPPYGGTTMLQYARPVDNEEE
ncbi:MAG: DUF881 domain-containing protein [bacterium]|nr:DUF881 domain-containing protein [bacterium]